MRADREIVLSAVSQTWIALCWAADELRGDPDIVAQTHFGGFPEALVLNLVVGNSLVLVGQRKRLRIRRR